MMPFLRKPQLTEPNHSQLTGHKPARHGVRLSRHNGIVEEEANADHLLQSVSYDIPDLLPIKLKLTLSRL